MYVSIKSRKFGTSTTQCFRPAVDKLLHDEVLWSLIIEGIT